MTLRIIPKLKYNYHLSLVVFLSLPSIAITMDIPLHKKIRRDNTVFFPTNNQINTITQTNIFQVILTIYTFGKDEQAVDLYLSSKLDTIFTAEKENIHHTVTELSNSILTLITTITSSSDDFANPIPHELKNIIMKILFNKACTVMKQEKIPTESFAITIFTKLLDAKILNQGQKNYILYFAALHRLNHLVIRALKHNANPLFKGSTAITLTENIQFLYTKKNKNWRYDDSYTSIIRLLENTTTPNNLDNDDTYEEEKDNNTKDNKNSSSYCIVS